MFARIVEFIPKPEKKEEFVKKVRNEVLPLLKAQKGFLEYLPFFPENKAEKVITITLWMEKWDVEKYEREVYPRVEEILKPYLVTPVTFKHYNVETTLCERCGDPGGLKQRPDGLGRSGNDCSGLLLGARSVRGRFLAQQCQGCLR